jgi:SAM-dependent methyltransferase
MGVREQEQAVTPLPLMQLATSFWAFKTLAGAVELDLFTHLSRAGPSTSAEIGDTLGLPERPALLLTAACASLGLLEKADAERYRNTPLAEEFLVAGKPYWFGGFVRYCDVREYPAWGRVVEALRGDRPLTWEPGPGVGLFDAEDPQMMGMFWGAMHSLSSFSARDFAAAFDLSDRTALLDVGGGSGAYPIELAKANPGLRAAVFDLPHVCEIAAERIAEAGLSERIATVPGDFLSGEPLPTGYDAILLSMILHDWDEPTGRRLLADCFEALEPGGIVIVCELLLDDDRSGPASAALMGMNMLVETEGGQNYTGAQYADWLVGAGFEPPRVIPLATAGANAALIATRR